MALNSPLLLVVILLGITLVARLRHATPLPVEGFPPGQPAWVPIAVGCVGALLTAWVWGGLRAEAVVHDEAAYLLQAGMFARARWTLPSPADFAAFTQAHVLVTPVIAAKYPPGHALILALGVVLGLPGLMPVLLAGLSAGLIYTIARRIWGAGVAVLTVALWLTQAGQWRWRASYYSETTTAALWLAGWWLLLQWRETRRTGWLVALAAVTGWGAITRPLTMLAFALPVGVVVLYDLRRMRHWRPLVFAGIAGTLVLLLLPVQNIAVLGNWRQSPLALYTRQYLPFDRPGFGVDSTPPALALPPDLQTAMSDFVAMHRAYQPATLPETLRERLGHVWTTAFTGWRKWLVVAGAIGLLLLGVYGWFAIASMLVLYLAYLIYAHPGPWTLYYYEVTPVFAIVIALGLEQILRFAIGRTSALRWASLFAAVGVLVVGSHDLSSSHDFRAAEQAPFRRLEFAANSTGEHLLAFIRYAPGHRPDISLVRNVADPAHAVLITAYDRGTDVNRRLAAAFPDRVPFIWDEASGQLLRAW